MDGLEETRKKIRERLIYEVNHPECWYSETDKARAARNKDIYVNKPECPYSSGTGNVREYWYVWWLNNPEDPILYGEVIHHINGNHQDNRIENLIKIKTKEHRKIHGKLIRDRNYIHKPISASTNKPTVKIETKTTPHKIDPIPIIIEPPKKTPEERKPYTSKHTNSVIMICPKDQQTMTRAGKGIRKNQGRCQKWQCSKCGHVVMENPAELAQAIPEKKVELLIPVAVLEAEMVGIGRTPEPSGMEPNIR